MFYELAEKLKADVLQLMKELEELRELAKQLFIDKERLERELDQALTREEKSVTRLWGAIERWTQRYKDAERDRDIAQAEAKRLREDAARYQFLRPHLITDGDVDDADASGRLYAWVRFKDDRVSVPDAAGYSTVDEAIDAALANTNGETNALT